MYLASEGAELDRRTLSGRAKNLAIPYPGPSGGVLRVTDDRERTQIGHWLMNGVAEPRTALPYSSRLGAAFLSPKWEYVVVLEVWGVQNSTALTTAPQ